MSLFVRHEQTGFDLSLPSQHVEPNGVPNAQAMSKRGQRKGPPVSERPFLFLNSIKVPL